MEIIGIIDYGSGNIHSATKAFENVAKDLKKEIKILRIHNAADIKLCDRVVLPGVGAFKDCKAGLVNIDGLVPTLEKKILDEGAPFLGICVGMQLLADIGFEGETTPGFGWIPGVVDKIPTTAGLKIPHMGWNTIKFNRAHSIFNGLENKGETIVYFVHSYYFDCANKDNILAETKYGTNFASIVGKENIYGVQFHPEKSSSQGLNLLKEFIGV